MTLAFSNVLQWLVMPTPSVWHTSSSGVRAKNRAIFGTQVGRHNCFIIAFLRHQNRLACQNSGPPRPLVTSSARGMAAALFLGKGIAKFSGLLKPAKE